MKSKIINIFLIMFVAMSFTGCWFHKDGRNLGCGRKQIVLTQEQEQNAKINTESLIIRDIKMIITIPAQFKAVHSLLDRLYAPIDGKVTDAYVEPGAIVKKGQVLARIKSDEIGQIQLEFLDKYIEVDSNVKQMQAMYNLSSQTYKRENLLYHEGISSRAEYEVARAQMQKDKANLDSLRIEKSTIIKVYAQRLALYGGDGGCIRTAVATKRIYPYVAIRANKSGIVLERKVNPGEVVEKDKELFDVADLSKIWLVGYAFEKDSQLLKVGQHVWGLLEEAEGKEVQGQLSYVSSILDNESKTLEVRADIPNKDFVIKPNMYAEMRVDVGTINALAVPNKALQKYGDYVFAYVKVKPHTYEERKVTVGHKNETYSEVLSGLKPGEQIVTTGAFSLLGESIKQKEE
jgi:cobalt-zinc-cadmium efflux system membrane fusion protein